MGNIWIIAKIVLNFDCFNYLLLWSKPPKNFKWLQMTTVLLFMILWVSNSGKRDILLCSMWCWLNWRSQHGFTHISGTLVLALAGIAWFLPWGPTLSWFLIIHYSSLGPFYVVIGFQRGYDRPSKILLKPRHESHISSLLPHSLVKISHSCSPHPKEGGMDSTSWRVEYQSHTAKGHTIWLPLLQPILETVYHTDFRDFPNERIINNYLLSE